MRRRFINEEDEEFIPGPRFGPGMRHRHPGPMGPRPPMETIFGLMGRRGPRHPGMNFGMGYGFLSHITQVIEGNNLAIYIFAPGLDKSTINIRAKKDKLAFSARRKEIYQAMLPRSNITANIDLIEEVDHMKSKASYNDGVIKIEIPILEEQVTDISMDDNTDE